MKTYFRTLSVSTAIAALFLVTGIAFGIDGLYINSNGNVGIGTTNPQAKLHVENNNDYLTLDHDGAQGLINAYNSDGSASDIMLWKKVVEGDTPALKIFGFDSNLDFEKKYAFFRINSWGELTIAGTVGRVNFNSLDSVNVTDDVHLTFGPGGGDYRMTYDSVNMQLNLWSNNMDGAGGNGNVVIIKDGTDDVIFNGSVGIGAENPSERLQIEGNIAPGTDNSYDLGTSSFRWKDIWATNSTIQTSDERRKENIADVSLGLDFISRLRPIAYKWKDYNIPEIIETQEVTRQKIQRVTKVVPEEVVELIDGRYVQRIIKKTEEVEEPVFEEYPLYDKSGNEIGTHRIPVMETVEEEVVTRQARIKKFDQTHYGFSAQQVKATLDSLGVDFDGIVYDEEADIYGIRMAEFVPILIKAVQELKAEVEKLKAELSQK